ncbi:MAG: hypothetical protein ABI467_12735 [Kofleriaceae bacterium]
MTRLAAIPLFGVALTLGGFGVIRGTMPAGPAAGIRLGLAIAPPVSDDVRDIAVHVARERIQDRGLETRVVPAGDHVIVELGGADATMVDEIAALLKRTAKLELHVVVPDTSWPAADYVTHDDLAKSLGIRVVGGALVADDRDDQLAVSDADAIGCRGPVADGTRRCLVRGDQVLATYLAPIPVLAVPHGHTLAYGRAGEHAWRTYLLDDPVLVGGGDVQRVELGDGEVIVELDPEAARRVAAQASTRAGVPIAVVLDGTVKAVAPLPPPRPEPTLHLRTTDPSGASSGSSGSSGSSSPGASGASGAGSADVTADRDALELKTVIEAGAVHPLSVVSSMPFTRAVGFLPRAWPFLALALLFSVAGAVFARRRRG